MLSRYLGLSCIDTKHHDRQQKDSSTHSHQGAYLLVQRYKLLINKYNIRW